MHCPCWAKFAVWKDERSTKIEAHCLLCCWVRQSVLWQQAVRCKATTPTVQLEMRRRPRETAEHVMRQEPQLGVGRRREPEKKSKTRNENNTNNFHSGRGIHSGSRIGSSPTQLHKICLHSSQTTRWLGFCLSRSTCLKNFLLYPSYGRGVHAPGLESQGRERALKSIPFPEIPTHATCPILVLTIDGSLLQVQHRSYHLPNFVFCEVA
jgi:hypothetical protein